MTTLKQCRQCGESMAMVDLFLEGYDLICVQCGLREIFHPEVEKAPACEQ
jgi:hypothetical protein